MYDRLSTQVERFILQIGPVLG
jgi:hypothetical protein